MFYLASHSHFALQIEEINVKIISEQSQTFVVAFCILE